MKRVKEKIINIYIKKIRKGKLSKEEEEILEEGRKRIKVGLTGGVFDLIHIGHVRAFKQAKKECDILVVVVAREEMIIKKGRKPIHTLKERVELVNSIKYVDLAIPGRENKEEVVEKINPDIIFYGYDQKQFLSPKGIKIVKLKPYKKGRIKTSIIEKQY